MESGTSKITPIFIFSLPRSGSTLLQKIIASSPEVSTASEPWFLLPLLYASKECGVLAEYSHKKSVLAIEDMKKVIISKGGDYDKILREFVLSLYAELSDENCRYFVDKTPRYYLIINEIVELFPDAKFIFLFRNPLAQLASKLNTHSNRIKTIYSAFVDIAQGPKLLSLGYRKYQDKSIKLTYRDLVGDSLNSINILNEYLEIDINPKIFYDLNQVKLQGIMGDPSLIQNVSKSINMKSLTKWISVFNTPLRRHLAKRYLINLHDHYFENLDSSKKELLIELSSVKLKFSMLWITDVYDLLYCYFNIKLKPYLFFSEEYKWVKSKQIN